MNVGNAIREMGLELNCYSKYVPVRVTPALRINNDC
jgi:hypothetical protein